VRDNFLQRFLENLVSGQKRGIARWSRKYGESSTGYLNIQFEKGPSKVELERKVLFALSMSVSCNSPLPVQVGKSLT
jgi:hypothetical protein